MKKHSLTGLRPTITKLGRQTLQLNCHRTRLKESQETHEALVLGVLRVGSHHCEETVLPFGDTDTLTGILPSLLS